MSFLRTGVGRPVDAGAYIGPGDIVAGAYAWWGLRAYTAAAAGTKAVRLIRSSDSSQADISTLTNGSLNTSDSFFNGSTYKVVTLYDQTLNGWDLTQGTDANRPVFTLSGIGSLPVMTYSGGTIGIKSNNTLTTNSQPISSYAIAKRTGAFTTQADIIQAVTGNIQALFASSSNTVGIYAGTGVATATASDSNWHTLQFLFNGGSSAIYVDGSGTTGLSTGTNGFVGGSGSLFQFLMGDDGSAGGNPLTATATEGGWWTSDISSSASALNNNAKSYWGY